MKRMVVAMLVLCLVTFAQPIFGGESMNATLPQDLQEHTISKMKIGESGYTVPWAMWADSSGALWLNGKYSIHSSPGGTVAMQVLRTSQGYHADIRKCPDHRWSTSGASYVGGADPQPVVKLIK